MQATLNTIRPALARLWGTTPDAIGNRVKKNYPLLREASGNAFRPGVAIPANSTVAAIVMLDWFDGGKLEEIGTRVPRLWNAKYTEAAGPTCPVSGASSLGQALVRLLDWDEVTDRLHRLELERETATTTLVWRGKVRPSVFHPFDTPQEWKRAVMAARRGVVHTVEVPGELFAQVAELIEKRG
jgi:hypothetical protein